VVAAGCHRGSPIVNDSGSLSQRWWSSSVNGAIVAALVLICINGGGSPSVNAGGSPQVTGGGSPGVIVW